MSIRSEEVNYLIYRYLQECGMYSSGLSIVGFDHTAFIFAHESMIDQVKVNDDQVKPGALISLLQKSIQYMELESHVKDVIGFVLRCNVVGRDRS